MISAYIPGAIPTRCLPYFVVASRRVLSDKIPGSILALRRKLVAVSDVAQRSSIARVRFLISARQ